MEATISGDARYTRTAIALHWAIAALILFNLSVGFFMEGLSSPWRIIVIGLHVSSGATILMLVVVRVIWRLTHKPPPFLQMKPWERVTARGVHFLLYAGMILMPLSGWAVVSANPPPGSPGAALVAAQRAAKAPPPAPGQSNARPARSGQRFIWGVIPLPMIQPLQQIGMTIDGVKPQRHVHDRFVAFHTVGGWLMILLLLFHIGGALKHQFIDRQRELARMGIGRLEDDGSDT